MTQPLSSDQAAKIVASHVRSIARKSGREITRDLCNEVLTMMVATGASTIPERTDEWLQNRVAPLADGDTVYRHALDAE